jgi:phenylacetate-CoA ligase
MSPYSRLISKVLFPLHERLKGHDTVAVFKKLEETQWWEPARHREQQLISLSSLLSHAGETCEYYRQTWSQIGFKPESVETLQDIQRLPILLRETIQDNVSKLRSTKPDFRLISKTTGGSTGLPLKFDLDSNSNDRRVAATLRGSL